MWKYCCSHLSVRKLRCVWEEETVSALSSNYLVLFVAETACEDSLYLRRTPFYSLPNTGHPLRFLLQINLTQSVLQNSSSTDTILRNLLSTSLFLFTWCTLIPPSHPARTQSNSRWFSLETNSRRKMQWRCSSWYCSTRETTNLRYVVTSSVTMLSFFSLLLCGCFNCEQFSTVDTNMGRQHLHVFSTLHLYDFCLGLHIVR